MKSYRLLNILTLTLTLTAASNAFGSIATQMLSEDLQAGIKTLPRETRMFHYFGINLGMKSKDQPNRLEDTSLKEFKNRNNMVVNRLEQVSAGFWDLNNNQTNDANAGIGLYLAIDPYISSPDNAADVGAKPGGFGSTMMEVTFHPGTKYLDLMKDVPLRQETIKAIQSETGLDDIDTKRLLGSRTEPPNNVSHIGFARDTVRYMAERQEDKNKRRAYENFRKMVHTVYAQNGIVMTEYGWQAATSAFCGSTNEHRSALVYVGNPSQINETVKSVTMVFWLPNSAKLEFQESESLERNTKLFSVLKPLRQLEKQYKSVKDGAYKARKAGDKVTAKNLEAELPKIMTEIQNEINKAYPNPSEVDELRSKTFECVK